MFKRIAVYLHEMYPVVPRLIASLGLFAGIYAATLFVAGKTFDGITYQDIIGVITVFGVLLSLRIADEFKDAETDEINFPHRPLPSGRVTKRDLRVLAAITLTILIGANVLFMPNLLFFLAMFGYGCLMTVWFFARKYIQPSLILALVTHNPIQLLIVYYVISLVAATHDFSPFTLSLLLAAFIFYLPALAWEVSRKIRAPHDEDQYVTYSQIFGRSRAIVIVMAVFLIQLIAVVALFWGQYAWIVAVAGSMYLLYVGASMYSMRRPEWMNYGKVARAYMYSFQLFLVAVSVVAIV